MISPEVPGFPGTGAQVREYFQIKALREKFDILLVSCVHPGFERYVDGIRRMAGGFFPVYPSKDYRVERPGETKSEYLYILYHILKERPLWVKYLEPYYDGMRKALRQVLGEGVDFILLAHTHLAPVLNGVDTGAAVKILDLHNLNFVIIKRQAENLASARRRLLERIESRKMKNYERRVLQEFDRLLAVSKIDAGIVRSMGIKKELDEIPNGVDTRYFIPVKSKGLERPRSLVFVGAMGYRANEDAALFFAREIFPSIKKKYPDATFRVVGGNPSDEIKSLSSTEGIEVMGFVEDIRPYVLEGSVFVVPLRIGGGTRIKILEAMSMGKSVLSTSIGAEGLDVEDGAEILIADDARDFAERISELFEDDGLRKKLGSAARQKVIRAYDWKSVGKKLTELLLSL